jgi:hypothetical protein
MASDCAKCDRSRAYPKETVPFLCTHIFPIGAQLKFKDNEYMIRKRGSWYYVGTCKHFKPKEIK